MIEIRVTSTPWPCPPSRHTTQNGLPLPSSAGLNLTNTSLLVENGYLTVASDFVVA